MVTKRIGLAAALASMLLAQVGEGQERQAPASQPQFGTVHFETSCSAAVQTRFDRAVALLHSFEFAPAIAGFDDVARADPSCGIAYWGLALASWGNPVRGRPEGAGADPAGAGGDRSGAARRRQERAREAPTSPQPPSCTGTPSTGTSTRASLAYRDAMAALAARHPEDMEAAIFYALALAQSVPPTDKTYADLAEGGRDPRAAVRHAPGPPGPRPLHHPQLRRAGARAAGAGGRPALRADRALGAPRAAHAVAHLHASRLLAGVHRRRTSPRRPRRSATAPRRRSCTPPTTRCTRTCRPARTRRRDGCSTPCPRSPRASIRTRSASAAPGVAGVFALAAIPARWALERHAWGEAAKLEPRPSRFPFTEAMTYFARGIGAARAGDERGGAVGDRRPRSRSTAASSPPTRATGPPRSRSRSAASRRGSRCAEGRRAEALAEMRAAAELEDGTEKNAITPGPIAPARELLGEMLLEVHAAGAGPRAVRRRPCRRSPTAFGPSPAPPRRPRKPETAQAAAQHYARLLKTCERADSPGRPELADARRFTSEAGSAPK